MEEEIVPFDEHLETCRNCDNEFDSVYTFCPYCGQQAKEDLTVGVLFYNTISNYFSFDARFLRSVIPLLFKPGYIARQFVEGKRLKYLHPAQYYLFVSVIFFFIFSFKVREYNENVDKVLEKGFEAVRANDSINVNPIDSSDVKDITKPFLNNPNITSGLSEEELKVLDSTLSTNLTKPKKTNFSLSYDSKKLDSLIAAGASEEKQLKVIGMQDDAGFMQRAFVKQVLKFHKQRGGGIVQVFFDSIPIALFFLLPIFALILKVFYWRRGRFAHHLVFSFYYFSFLFIVLGLIIGFNQWVTEIPSWLGWLIMLSTFFYLWLALKHFYRQGYFLSLFKTGMVSFVYMMFIIPMALIIVLITSFLFY